LGAGDIGALSQHVSLRPGEYSYFSPRTLNMWAGPEHWRFRQPPAPHLPKDSRRRIPKKPFELDFEADTDFKPYFHKPKASITLSKSVLERRNVRNTTLPEDFNYDPQLLEQLFLKPHVRLSQISNPAGTLDSDAGIEDYDYNNPNDTSNFCPALQVPDSDSDADPSPDPDVDPTEFPAGAGALPAHPQAPELFGIGGGLELIAEPQKVHKIPIQYARTAKRMDMKRLKRNMWELLTETEGEESEEGLEPKMVGEKMLSDLTKDLQRRLPPAMATNLSVPLAFISLLHLASEKNLQLESTEDLSDVVIKPGD
ncbi:CND2 protein, partial [Sitta europaea]|nr:CND2 protein [Sitta europaea]